MKQTPPTRKHKNNLHTKHNTLEQSSTKPCWQKPLNFEVGAWGHMGECVYNWWMTPYNNAGLM